MTINLWTVPSEDAHFNSLKDETFPKVNVIRLRNFLELLSGQLFSKHEGVSKCKNDCQKVMSF